MSEESTIQKILHFLIFILLIVLLFITFYTAYIMYTNSIQEENGSVILPSDQTEPGPNSEVRQFAKNMKFNHNNITYEFYDCTLDKQQSMLQAFNIFSNETGLITFKQSNNPDIEVICSEKKESKIDSEFFIAGEGGPREIIQTSKYNIITQGSVLLYNSPTGALNCNLPLIPLHELIHAFGFDHSDNKNSLMYPYLTSCNQKLDLSIIQELKRLYSEENLPDLYFEEFNNPVKKGRYLNMNFSIKNSGTIDAENVTFAIIEDNKLLEVDTIGTIKYGAGILMKIENLRLNSQNPEKVSIIIDNDNKIKEIDKNNNIADIKFK